MLARGMARDILLDHVAAHLLRIALERIAPTAAAGMPHADHGIRGHQRAAAITLAKVVVAGLAHTVAAIDAGIAAPNAPGGKSLAMWPVEIPTPFHEVAQLQLDAEAAAMLAGAAGILQ